MIDLDLNTLEQVTGGGQCLGLSIVAGEHGVCIGVWWPN